MLVFLYNLMQLSYNLEPSDHSSLNFVLVHMLFIFNLVAEK